MVLPYWNQCADFWFSTEVDPIEETGGEGKIDFSMAIGKINNQK